MVEEDTVKLLRECNAGIRMGVSSIDEVLRSLKEKKGVTNVRLIDLE